MKSWNLAATAALGFVVAGAGQAANVIPQSLANVSGVTFSVTNNVPFGEVGRDLNTQIDWFVFDVRPTQTEDTIFDFTRLSRLTQLSVSVYAGDVSRFDLNDRPAISNITDVTLGAQTGPLLYRGIVTSEYGARGGPTNDANPLGIFNNWGDPFLRFKLFDPNGNNLAGRYSLAVYASTEEPLSGGSYVLNTNAVAAVPEPASLAMLLAGLGVVAGAVRRRRSTHG
jgi:hypothetical protein